MKKILKTKCDDKDLKVYADRGSAARKSIWRRTWS